MQLGSGAAVTGVAACGGGMRTGSVTQGGSGEPRGVVTRGSASFAAASWLAKACWQLASDHRHANAQTSGVCEQAIAHPFLLSGLRILLGGVSRRSAQSAGFSYGRCVLRVVRVKLPC